MFTDGTLAFPKREDTMSLDVIHPSDVPNGHIYAVKTRDQSLTTEDIERCQPYYKHKKFGADKENLTKPWTAQGSPYQRSRTFYPNPVRKARDLSLTVGDIEGARPNKTVVFRGQRHLDPLQPIYCLASISQNEFTPRRFSKRPVNYIDDIELAKSQTYTKNYTKNLNDSSDIAYTCPNYRRRVVRPLRSGQKSKQYVTGSLSTKGIESDYKIPFRTSNPIDPEYTVSQASITSLQGNWNEEKSLNTGTSNKDNPLINKPTKIGMVPGSKPRKLQWSNGEPQLSLVTQDVAGAAPQRFCGERPIHVYDSVETRPPVNFHDTYDIPGAQVSTLKKGIVTGRCINPLRPNYTLLDGNATSFNKMGTHPVGNSSVASLSGNNDTIKSGIHVGGEAQNLGGSGAPPRMGV